MFFWSKNWCKSIFVTSAAVVALCLLLACVSVTFLPPASATTNSGAYYSRLDSQAQKFYDAILDMYNRGSLKTGTVEYDLIDRDVVSAMDAQNYIDGDASLESSFEAARSAFCMEHNVFYVDFSKFELSIGVKDNKYVVTMGAGRNSDYYAAGFSSERQIEALVEEYNTDLSALVNIAREGETVAEKIKLCNAAILEKASFGYGINSTGGIMEQAAHITSSLGALKYGVATYEGFSRLFADVLTQLDVENVLISGYFLNENESFVPAMWNYVQIGGSWYAIDAGLNSQSTDNEEYLLVGQEKMRYQHYVGTDAMTKTVAHSIDLSKYDYGYVAPVEVSATFGQTAQIAAYYMDKNSTKLQQQGLYLAFRISQDKYDADAKTWGNWYAFVVAVSVENGAFAGLIVEKVNATTMTLPDSAAVIQVAVLNVAPTSNTGEYSSVADENIISISAEIANRNYEGFVSAPTAKKVVPSNAEILDVDKTYTIVIEYDEPLIKNLANKEISVNVLASRGASVGSVTQIFWDSVQAPETISFVFTASPLYCDNFQTYTFELQNLIGSKSKKTPQSVSFEFQKFNINLSDLSTNSMSGVLTLSQNNTLDLSGWSFQSTSSYQHASNVLSSQLAFVSSSLNPVLTDQMLAAVSTQYQLGSGHIVSYSGNCVDLSLCGGQVTFMNGQMVKISQKVANTNLYYTAYCCSKGSDGSMDLTKIAQMQCFLNGDELIIELNKFDYLLILGLNPSATPASRVLYVNNVNHNGAITAKINGATKTDIIALSLDQSVILEFTPSSDYQLATCLLNGKTLSIEDNKVIISFNDLVMSNVLDVCFVSSRVANYEATIGLSNLQAEHIANMYAPESKNVGLLVCIILAAAVAFGLLIAWLAVFFKNRKR